MWKKLFYPTLITALVIWDLAPIDKNAMAEQIALILVRAMIVTDLQIVVLRQVLKGE